MHQHTASIGPARPMSRIERALVDIGQYRAGLAQVRLTHPGTPRADRASRQSIALLTLIDQFEPTPALATVGDLWAIDDVLEELGQAAAQADTDAQAALARRWLDAITLVYHMTIYRPAWPKETAAA